MRRLTNLITVLAMLSLGMGLSQALHVAVAHSTASTWSDVSPCGACATSAGTASTSQDQAPPSTPSHADDECAVCATIAATKLVIPVPMASLTAFAPVTESFAAPEAQAPRAAPLCVLRSRAPPTT